ncbi:MAG: cob(I)alamin adenosyltransferase [Alphaproteobacteria bacterium]|jgi:cob(I)alamin adenosyltransferase
MVVLTKIYTKTGDKGETSLGDGSRELKNHVRIDAYGTVDEANSVLGLAALYADKTALKDIIYHIQNDLFDCGADLCVPETDQDLGYTPLRMTAEQTLYLEKQIDFLNQDLPNLTSFILPGGTHLAGHLHHARTIVRRGERLVVQLMQQETINDAIITYLNRLSDFLFVAARYDNFHAHGDILWVVGKNR